MPQANHFGRIMTGKFNEDIEWQLKGKLAKHAMPDPLPVEVQRAGHKIFHASRNGG
jgi:hypothetical protein